MTLKDSFYFKVKIFFRLYIYIHVVVDFVDSLYKKR